jgi:hypothetical protein
LAGMRFAGLDGLFPEARIGERVRRSHFSPAPAYMSTGLILGSRPLLLLPVVRTNCGCEPTRLPTAVPEEPLRSSVSNFQVGFFKGIAHNVDHFGPQLTGILTLCTLRKCLVHSISGISSRFVQEEAAVKLSKASPMSQSCWTCRGKAVARR